MSFAEQLEIGKAGESDVARWLMGKGCRILPVYEIGENQFKGPVFYAATGEKLVAPDLLVFGKDMFWAEVKTKSAFTWHRMTQRFVTGIDIGHYNDYLKIKDMVSIPIWLFFYHGEGCAKDSAPGPSGLYGAPISHLRKNENHRHSNWGKRGMVYWSHETLKKFSDYPLA